MTDPANVITFTLKVLVLKPFIVIVDLLFLFQELTATETRGFVNDNFVRYLGSRITLDHLYDEQFRIYNLGNEQVFTIDIFFILFFLRK